MSFLNTLNITGSALTSERFRMDIINHNLTNLTTTRTKDGGPYRRKQVIFEERSLRFQDLLDKESANLTKGGVRVKEIVENPSDFVPVYEPTHPDADENGYVLYPNVNRTEEQIDLMAASRAYEANLTALATIKALSAKALEIGK